MCQIEEQSMLNGDPEETGTWDSTPFISQAFPPAWRPPSLHTELTPTSMRHQCLMLLMAVFPALCLTKCTDDYSNSSRSCG